MAVTTDSTAKGNSPFTPGAPVPVELFVGRRAQIDRIEQRGIGQVERQKPIAMFIEGEYGIGKSSMARLVQLLAESEHHLLPVYVTLYGVKTVEDLCALITEAVLKTSVLNARLWERIRKWVGKYVSQASLFGVTFDAEAMRRDAPKMPAGILSFLDQLLERAQPEGYKGVFLVLDEINGITGNPQFARFIKSLVDENALARKPVPLLLLLCGVKERRWEMIRHHPPVDRIFDIVDIEALSEEESREFFLRAFDSVKMTVDAKALSTMTHWSAGLPRILHLVGDAAYWRDRDGELSEEDAKEAVWLAAEEVGKKYVDQQVYHAVRSRDYLAILSKIVREGPQPSFQKGELEKRLTPAERGKLGNFLQRMKRLNILRSGEELGEYVFNIRMVPVYVWLQTVGRKRREN